VAPRTAVSQRADSSGRGLGPEGRELVWSHDHVAEIRARRFASKTRGIRWLFPFEDLFQEARLALCRAALRYDPGRALFRSFAEPHVDGAILHYLRDARLIRWPRDGSAPLLTVPVFEFREEDLTEDDGFTEEVAARVDARREARRLLGSLPAAHRRILLMRAGGLTQAEVAVRLGVSVQTVFRCEREARAMARGELAYRTAPRRLSPKPAAPHVLTLEEINRLHPHDPIVLGKRRGGFGKKRAKRPRLEEAS